MKSFATLYRRLDAATSTKHKGQALQDYMRAAVADERLHASAAWAVYFLAGGKPRQMIATKLLRAFALEQTRLPEWLFEECYQSVGDLAETLALLLPFPEAMEDVPLDVWMSERLLSLRGLDDAQRLERLRRWVSVLPRAERLPFFKLTTGALRIGVSKLQVIRALSDATGVDAKRMAQRMMGYTQAGRTLRAADFAALTGAADGEPQQGGGDGHPYPFFLAHSFQAPVDAMPALLGPVENWLVEWKFDGIRAQYIQRADQWWLWSRGEELVSESFPEMAALRSWLPEGVVLDGELVVVAAGSATDPIAADALRDIRPFASLQQRLGRKNLGAKILRELPVALIAYDMLEYDGQDVRLRPQSERRVLLEEQVLEARAKAAAMGREIPLRLSPLLQGADWRSLQARREEARLFGAEGLMLKARTTEYGVGRRKGGVGGADLWWKWKLDPMSVDAVLIYAQRGHGRRSGVYSDYTFAVWSGPPEDANRALVPFAKAYSGLSDEEMSQVDAIIRKTTVESFGPVRSVRPTMVFELGFEGITLSKRHKSGIATRFPRMLRWRRDKPVEEADTVEQLQALLPSGTK
jgi:ATP-dependent DNA ligase